MLYILYVYTNIIMSKSQHQDEWLEKQRNLFTVPKQKFLITLY